MRKRGKNRWVKRVDGKDRLVPVEDLTETNAAVEFEGATLLVASVTLQERPPQAVDEGVPLIEAWVRLVAWESGQLVDWLFGDSEKYGSNLVWVRYIGDRKEVRDAARRWMHVSPFADPIWAKSSDEPRSVARAREAGKYSPEEVLAALGQQVPGEGWSGGSFVSLD